MSLFFIYSVIGIMGLTIMIRMRRLSEFDRYRGNSKIINGIIFSFDSQFFYFMLAAFAIVNLFLFPLEYMKLSGTTSAFITNGVTMFALADMVIVNWSMFSAAILFFKRGTKVTNSFFFFLSIFTTVGLFFLNIITSTYPLRIFVVSADLGVIFTVLIFLFTLIDVWFISSHLKQILRIARGEKDKLLVDKKNKEYKEIDIDPGSTVSRKSLSTYLGREITFGNRKSEIRAINRKASKDSKNTKK